MRLLLLFAILFLSTVAFPVNDNTSSDATSMALGGVSVVQESVYGSFNNQAVLATLDKTTLATSYARRFSLSDAQVMLACPTSFGTLGFNVSCFGSSLYGETKAGASYSRLFGDRFSGSLQFDLLGINGADYQESVYAFTSEIGLWARLLDDLTFGFHVYNFINAEYRGVYYDEAIPVNMKLGLAYSILDNFSLSSEIENSSLYGTSLRGGMAYHIVDQVVFRTGMASNPSLVSLGLGVQFAGFNLDIAAQSVRYIGKTGAVSISYAF